MSEPLTREGIIQAVDNLRNVCQTEGFSYTAALLNMVSIALLTECEGHYAAICTHIIQLVERRDFPESKKSV